MLNAHGPEDIFSVIFLFLLQTQLVQALDDV